MPGKQDDWAERECETALMDFLGYPVRKKFHHGFQTTDSTEDDKASQKFQDSFSDVLLRRLILPGWSLWDDSEPNKKKKKGATPSKKREWRAFAKHSNQKEKQKMKMHTKSGQNQKNPLRRKCR